MPKKSIMILSAILGCAACTDKPVADLEGSASSWLLVDDFESGLGQWTFVDVQNETDPFVPDPQIAEIHIDADTGSHFMLRKPAVDGLVGNRKGIGFAPLPVTVKPGETYTFYTRINVEYFPNNQSFGLTSVGAEEIPVLNYESFEPMIRVTDRTEGNGYQNTGALQVLGGGDMRYSDIFNPASGEPAKPLQTDEWYEVWYVVNNAPYDAGGQRYDLYIRGGEFADQQMAFEDAVFRVRREAPLQYFMTTCNTGSKDKPYGNGGVRYDDIYMASGLNLTSPLQSATR